MPISSLWCPPTTPNGGGCGAGEVPVDHYRSGACAHPPMPIPWICGIIANTIGDTRHKAGQVHATGLAGCPRAEAINWYLPVPKVDLRRYNSIAHGWAGHAFMAAHTPPEMMSEMAFGGTLFRGTPYEVYVAGHGDVIKPRPLDPGIVIAEDYKFTSTPNQMRMSGVTEKVEWNIQMSVYHHLAPQLDIRELAIWSGAPMPVKAQVEPWVRVPARLLSEDEILQAKPYEGESTVAEHIEDFLALQRRLADGMDPGEAIACMPLRGEQQWRKDNGTSKCDYCVMSEVCGRLARRAGGWM